MADRSRIAIIDDEQSIRRALVRLFRLAHYEAVSFFSASEFLESYQAGERFDCIVLDLKMPGMSGLDLLRHLAALDNTPPVIVITAEAGERTETECKRLGSTNFLRKPVDGRVLVDTVHAILDS